jgi:hypothetical protein
VRTSARSATRPAVTAQPCSVTRLGDELDPMLAAPLKLALEAAGLRSPDVGAALDVGAARAREMLDGRRPIYLRHLYKLARRCPAAAPACRAALAALSALL